jgi:hypothetical protein
MTIAYSSDLKLSLIATGTEAGVWGSITNTNLVLIQQAIAGYEKYLLQVELKQQLLR